MRVGEIVAEHLILGKQTSLPGQYNARGFGAIPIEEQAGFDSTSALIAASAKASLDGYELFIPPGTYRITASWVITDTKSVRIRGAGADTIIQPSANTFDAIVVGKNNSNGSSGHLRDLVVSGNTARPTNGRAGVKIDQLKMFEVSNVTVDNYDIGFDLVNACPGAVFRNCATGTGTNVGVNIRTGAQSGNDISFHNMNLYGEVAAVHISGGSRGFSFYGGTFNSNNNSGTTPNDNKAVVILGKDYLSGTTGACSDVIIKGVDFKSFRYCWGVRSYDAATFVLEQCNINADVSPAMGLLNMSTATDSKVSMINVTINGTYSGATLVSIAGDTNNFSIAEMGNFYNATINGAVSSGGSILIQSQIAKGQALTRLAGKNVVVLGPLIVRENGTTLQTSPDWGTNWTSLSSASIASGTTANRPTGVSIGFPYFDTDLNAPIWWNGTMWVVGGSGGGGGTLPTTTALAAPGVGFRGNMVVLAGVVGVAEVSSLTLTAPATTSGNVTVTLDGVAFIVPILSTDNTTVLVANKIRAATYTGWTTGGTGATVTFTCAKTGVKTDITYSAGTTGATANVSTTTQGVESTPDSVYVCIKLGNDTYDWVQMR